GRPGALVGLGQGTRGPARGGRRALRQPRVDGLERPPGQLPDVLKRQTESFHETPPAEAPPRTDAGWTASDKEAGAHLEQIKTIGKSSCLPPRRRHSAGAESRGDSAGASGGRVLDLGPIALRGVRPSSV